MRLPKKVLFICEGNLHRSPTAARLYATTPGIKARSAGLSSLARVQVTEELLAWADIVFVMERRLRRLLKQQFTTALKPEKLICLDIRDDFQFMQAELVAILTERLTPYLGEPASQSMDEN